MQRHQDICCQQDGMEITMPSPKNDRHISAYFFQNICEPLFVPRVIYFHLESLIVPVDGAEPDPEKSSTTIIEKHEKCDYGLAVVEFEKKHGEVRATTRAR